MKDVTKKRVHHAFIDFSYVDDTFKLPPIKLIKPFIKSSQAVGKTTKNNNVDIRYITMFRQEFYVYVSGGRDQTIDRSSGLRARKLTMYSLY